MVLYSGGNATARFQPEAMDNARLPRAETNAFFFSRSKQERYRK